jgi:hypothetical protein
MDFSKMLHALCMIPWENTPGLTVALHVGRSVRMFVTGF